MNITVSTLIDEIISYFEGTLVPSYDYLLCEYNRIVRELLIMLPSSDASVTLMPVGGKLECNILPRQIKRVFFGDSELLRASRELVGLLPEAKLYHAADDGIYVTVNSECTVCYRLLPNALSDVESLSAIIPGDDTFILLVRKHLERCAYMHVGDYDSADACAVEYNSLLEDYKRANGVAL
ncbi:MAG: hypothetical protein IJN48_00410 [Clostridia bacterium]|nr:hypothetical protein [Clostridia bacterium]